MVKPKFSTPVATNHHSALYPKRPKKKVVRR
jgi:hypothetical protein